MKKQKITFLVNFILIITVVSVYLIALIPEKIVPIYSEATLNAIYNGNKENKNVSLMFNVYENTEVVEKIIDLLDSEGVKCTFFVGGCWADDNQNTLLKMKKSGHEIANHGYFHKDHSKLNYEKNEQEIFLTEKIVEVLSGEKTKLFAPPSGSFSNTTLEVAYDLGYKVIMWSKDTIDWRDNDPKLIFNRATKNISNGDLVLMHPKEQTLLALFDVLRYYKNNGFNVVTVSENLL